MLRTGLLLSCALALLRACVRAGPDHGRAAPATRRRSGRTSRCSSSRRPPGSGTTRSRPAATRSARWRARDGIAVDWTEDSAVFTAETLAHYDAVVFLSTTGDPLDDAQQAAFEDYIRAGGGYAGIHAASDTEYDWAWYGGLVGAYFESHPPIQDATVEVSDRKHPSTADLPQRWQRTDEWYSFRSNPRGRRARARHARRDDVRRRRRWRRPPDRLVPRLRRRALLVHGRRPHGRVLRRAGVPAAPARRHQVGGQASPRASAAAPMWGNFERVTLAKGAEETGEPIGLAVLPDRSVLHTSRDGTVRYTDATGETKVAANDPRLQPRRGRPAGDHARPRLRDQPLGLRLLRAAAEHARRRRAVRRHGGAVRALQGRQPPVALQVGPGRARSSTSRASRSCSRSTRTAASAATTAATSPGTPPATCTCRPATTPTRSSPRATAPIDERADAQPGLRRAAHRGEHERPARQDPADQAAPGRRRRYTVPAGNLFAPGAAGTRPEIYAMGFRNPFRIAVDRETGYVYVGDYGPDAAAPTRRAAPTARSSSASCARPGNFGWPYCIGDNDAYRDYDFATGDLGRGVRLRRAGQRVAAQHRRPAAPARRRAGHLVRHRRPVGGGDAARRLGVADGRPGLPLRRRQPVRRPSSPPTTTTTGSRTSGGATGSRRPRSTPRGGPLEVSAVPRRRRVPLAEPDGHGVRARGLALRARLRQQLVRRRRPTRRSTASTTSRAAGARSWRRAPTRPRPARRTLDRAVLERGLARPRRRRRSPTSGTSATARRARPSRTRATPTARSAPTGRR